MAVSNTTMKGFENRSRESLVEEIMTLRWLRTRLDIHTADAAGHLSALQDAIASSREYQKENFGEGLGENRETGEK